MTDSKSTCCGKPVNVFNGDEGTNNWICGACRKACDVVTDLKTAEQISNEFVSNYQIESDHMLADPDKLEELVAQAILSYASDKDKRVAQLEAEVKRLKKSQVTYSLEPGQSKVNDELRDELAQLQLENERLKSDSSSGLSVKYKLELLKQIWKLQLENGVKDEAIRVGLSHLEERAGCKDCPELKQMEQALSTSTKSSLMEKVRHLVTATDALLKYELDEVVEAKVWKELESALTEVKKEIGA